MVIKRSHSPDYPGISLREAIDRVRRVHAKIQTHAAPRELIATGMGYSTLNGASMSAIAALRKFGLLIKVGDQMKLSSSAMKILFPESEAERNSALREAALTPALFGELYTAYDGQVPDDDLIRNQLLRKGFLLSALPSVISSFKETMALVQPEPTSAVAEIADDSESDGEKNLIISTYTPVERGLVSPTPVPSSQGTVALGSAERRIFGYEFETGGSISVIISGNAETLEALEIVSDWIDLKKKELARKAARERSAAPEGSSL